MAADCSPTSSSATRPSAPLNENRTARPYYVPARNKTSYRSSQSMTTCAPLTADRGAVQLTFFQEESPAKDSAEQASSSESSTPATSGRTRSGSSKSAARRGSSSKTWTALHRSTIGESFCKTLRRQGMMLAGVCSALEMWVLPTFASGSGCSQLTQKTFFQPAPWQQEDQGWWPTPCSRDFRSGNLSPEAYEHARSTRSSLPLPELLGGLLNPTWVEWLMGWPIDWTDPDGGPSREDFHEWLESNRTALTAYVAAATVRYHSAKPSHGSC
jgi:hypothetical protein